MSEYLEEMCETFEVCWVEDESLWIELTAPFRTICLKALKCSECRLWIEYLTSFGVFVQQGRHLTQNESVLECLLRESYVSFDQWNEKSSTEETSSQEECEYCERVIDYRYRSGF